ncbi:MAG: hypothetical protein HY459_03500 [Parcubacteria group bacterium]|nr:hypothetical protein [Parcubacteria group bacterium]
MTPEHKIWAVIQAIAETVEIAPSGQPLEISPKELLKIMSSSELKQIFQKLAGDEKILELKRIPGLLAPIVLDGDEDAYWINIPNFEAFRAYYDKAHFKFFGSLEKISGDNFLAVVDVTMDIQECLEVTPTNEIVIPIKRDIIRFPALYPGHAPNLMDRYCTLRRIGIAYLKENGHIRDYEIHRDGMIGWDAAVTIAVDRMEFTRFYKRLIEIYPKKIRAEETPKKQAQKSLTDEEQRLLD